MIVTASFATSTGSLAIGSITIDTYLTFVQPWFSVLGVLENALIALVLSFWLPSQRGHRAMFDTNCKSRQASTSSCAAGGLATVSRIYYILIALCELTLCLFGFLIRNGLKLLPYWVWNCVHCTVHYEYGCRVEEYTFTFWIKSVIPVSRFLVGKL